MKKITIYKFISLVICLVLCLGLLSGCESWNNFRKAFIDPPQPEIMTIKVGILEPQTGRRSYDAEDEMAGMELAHELFPEAGGYAVELLYEDNRSNTDICKEAAQKLVDRGCAVILGSVSDTLSLAASDVINENKIPAIAATNTVPILTQTNPYYLRVNVINSFDAEGAAEYAYKEIEAKSVVVLLPEGNDYAQTKAEVFEEAFVDAVGYDSFEYSYKELDEETNKIVEKRAMSPAVYYIYINGEETQERMDYVFGEMDKMGCYSFYCPCESSAALPWIIASQAFEFPTEETQKTEPPKDLTTMGYWDDAGNWVEEKGYWDDWGNWVKWVEPQAAPQEETEEKYFTWIGTDLWQGIEAEASSSYGYSSMLYNVCYTLSYDGAINNEMAEAFLDAYHAKYGSDASPSSNFALGFDAYLLAYQAMCNVIEENKNAPVKEQSAEELPEGESAGNSIPLFDENKVFSRELLTKALYRIKNLAGATGTITMNENGDPTKDIIIKAFNGEEFVTVYTAFSGDTEGSGE
ncbi:MAG: ABC transporter substrate-binding protein [Firmicutes bacterium]|nr:ABC transporter substrate-binding protein [Bacillota bacterium]